MGKKEFVPSIGPVKAKIITNIVKKHKPKRILEIGTLYGYSAILMANLLDDAADSVGSVITIEIDKTVAKTARKNMGSNKHKIWAISRGNSMRINILSRNWISIHENKTEPCGSAYQNRYRYH